jgi:hypothetical protein
VQECWNVGMLWECCVGAEMTSKDGTYQAQDKMLTPTQEHTSLHKTQMHLLASRT